MIKTGMNTSKACKELGCTFVKGRSVNDFYK